MIRPTLQVRGLRLRKVKKLPKPHSSYVEPRDRPAVRNQRENVYDALRTVPGV